MVDGGGIRAFAVAQPLAHGGGHGRAAIKAQALLFFPQLLATGPTPLFRHDLKMPHQEKVDKLNMFCSSLSPLTGVTEKKAETAFNSGRQHLGVEMAAGPEASGLSDLPSDMLDIILGRLPDAVISVGGDGRILWVSPNVRRLLGYDAAELVGHDVSVIYAVASDRKVVLDLVRAGQGEAVRVEFQARAKAGGDVWVVAYGCAVFDDQGRFNGVRGVLRDISENHRMRKTLEDSEDRFRRLSDVTNEAICIHFQGRILDCNRAFHDLFGYERADFDTLTAWNVIHTDDLPLAREMVRIQYQKPYEVRGVRKDGSVFPMEIHSKESWMGDVAVRVTCIRDMTEQKKAETSLNLLSQAVEQSPVAVAVVTDQGLVEYVNPAHQRITGHAADTVIGHPLAGLYPGQSRAWFGEMWQALCRGADWGGEVPVVGEDGKLRWQQIFASPVAPQGQDITHHLVVVEDVSLRKEQDRKILHQALYDGLTDLPNRAMALDRLTVATEEARDAGTRVGLLFVDLDDFKGINDSLGHEYGDELLILASERLCQAVGEGGMVARFGGDEFLVILPLVSPEQAEWAADRIVQAFVEPFTISRRDLITTASIGVALYPDHADCAETLLSHADAAMYHAKAGGNAYRFYDSDMDRQAAERVNLENDLRHALAEGQFRLNYQPKIDGISRKVVAAEALIRWKHPTRGNVSPALFIPVAERAGLIGAIGDWALQEACRQMRLWLDDGLEFGCISVNLSPAQFHDASLKHKIERSLSQWGLSPSLLELEITETMMATEVDRAIAIVGELGQMGVRMSIDDFGTGYSSLAYLKLFPVNVLKIDRAFIKELPGNRKDGAIVSSIATLAANLGFEVIAEGVETQAQAGFLLTKGVTLMQGFLFSPAVPPDEFAQLVRTGV